MEYRDVGVGGAKAMLDWLLHHRHQQTFFNDQDMQNCRCSQSQREFASNITARSRCEQIVRLPKIHFYHFIWHQCGYTRYVLIVR